MLTRRERAWLRLHLVKGLGRRGLFQLQQSFQSPEEALNAGPAHWPARVGAQYSGNIRLPDVDGRDYQSAISALEKSSARIVSFWDEPYPEMLKTIHDPPALLYVRGNLGDAPALAVVGSRRCST